MNHCFTTFQPALKSRITHIGRVEDLGTRSDIVSDLVIHHPELGFPSDHMLSWRSCSMTTAGYICLSATCREEDSRLISSAFPGIIHSDGGLLKLTLVVVFVCPL